jgi:uroporphyrinogen-III synthase
MPHLVLVTRPKEQAKDLIQSIYGLGGIPLVQPLLSIVKCNPSFDGLDRPEAIIITSSQAVVMVPYASADSIPVYCVGKKTAEQAKQAGYLYVQSAEGNVQDLIKLIRHRVKQGDKILYLRGEFITHNLVQDLRDYVCQEIIMYQALAIDYFSQDILDKFSEIAVITLFSPRSGQILKMNIDRYSLETYLLRIKLLCLSEAVLESVQDLPWASCHVSPQPNIDSFVTKLRDIL